MEIQTNAARLIPQRKVYCGFSIQLDRIAAPGNLRTFGDYQGIWNEINYEVTPVR